MQHQFARHLRKDRRAGGHGTDCNWAPQRRPCFPRGLLVCYSSRRRRTQELRDALTHNARRSSDCAARSLSCRNVGAALLHGGVTSALALVVRENFTRWGRGTCLTLTIAPGYLRTLAQGFRQTCIMSVLTEQHWAQTSPLAQIKRAEEVGRSDR